VAVIRVLIAGPTARIVHDLEKLEPHREAIDVCGIARRPSEILEEARVRQPDVVLLHDGFTALPAADLEGQIEPLSPGTRVLRVGLPGDTATGSEREAWVGDEADGRQLADAITTAAGHAPAPAGAVQNEVSKAPRTSLHRRRFSLGRR